MATKEEKRREGKWDEEAVCLPTDADEEERAAPITPAAHPRGGRRQAFQKEGVEKVTGGVSFNFSKEEGRRWDER